MEQLKQYPGNLFDLAPAEQFLLQLSDIPDYRCIISGLVFRVDYFPKYIKLKAAFDAMAIACGEVLRNRHLRAFLHMILDAGNFLNTVKKNY